MSLNTNLIFMQFDGHIQYSNRAVQEFNIIKYLMGNGEMFKFFSFNKYLQQSPSCKSVEISKRYIGAAWNLWGAPRVQMVLTHHFLLISFDLISDRLYWGRQTTFGQLLLFFFFNSIYNFLVQRISSMALLWLLNIFRFDSVIRHILKPCLKIFFLHVYLHKYLSYNQINRHLSLSLLQKLIDRSKLSSSC